MKRILVLISLCLLLQRCSTVEHVDPLQKVAEVKLKPLNFKAQFTQGTVNGKPIDMRSIPFVVEIRNYDMKLNIGVNPTMTGKIKYERYKEKDEDFLVGKHRIYNLSWIVNGRLILVECSVIEDTDVIIGTTVNGVGNVLLTIVDGNNEYMLYK